MPKAILELEMPESCWDCPLVQGRELSPTTRRWCGYSGKDCPAPAYQGRRPDCPLKLVDEHCRNAEWVNGKCRGHRISPYTYEVLVQCKNCKDFEEYKEVE